MGTRLFGLPRTPVIVGLAVAALLVGVVSFLVFARASPEVAEADVTPEPSASASPAASASPTEEASLSPSPTGTPVATTLPTPYVAICPLTGLPSAVDLTNRDPLLVQVENHPDARPQSNLGRADLLIEAPVEGDTTRFSALFLCQATDGLVGPVRSGRYYNVDLWQQMRVIGVGFGASPGTEQRFFPLGVSFLNGIYGEFPQFFPRTSDRVAPHNLYLDIDALRAALEAQDTPRLEDFRAAAGGLRPPFEFGSAAALAEIGRPVGNLTIYTTSFWVFGWRFDAEENVYVRSDAGVEQVDAVDGAPITRRSLVVQIVSQETVYGDPDPGGYPRRDQHLVGEGSGIAYVDGMAVDLRWSRPDADSLTQWTIVATGEPLVLPPGTVYWGIIPDTGSVIEE